MRISTVIEVNICKRCEHAWRPKVEIPKACPACHSPYWDRERLIRGESKSVNKYGFDRLQVGVEMAFPYPLLSNGELDKDAATKRALSLGQFMRRRGFTYSWRGLGKNLYITRRS